MTTAIPPAPSSSGSFRDFHAVELPRQLAERDDSLPRGYARTLRPLGIRLRETGDAVTYRCRDRRIDVEAGDAADATLVELAAEDWDFLRRDLESAPGLIYGQRVARLRGDLMQLLQWEPALRWLYTGRPVYDPDAVDLRDAAGRPLDPAHGFTLDDDRDEMAHFLREVGYVWVRGVLSPDEVAELRREADVLRAEAREGDQESWWGRRADGSSALCRVLRAGRLPAMRRLRSDPRLLSLPELCDTPLAASQAPDDKDGVTVLWKQPGVTEGLGDLPWHRDCGMGGHASICPTAVMSIFLGPNTPEAGELRFLPGSWRTSFPFAEADDTSTPRGVAPPAMPGDVTLHYGDGMHVAPPPTREEGPHRVCILMGFKRVGARHHRGERHYNDVLLGSEDGQIQHMRKVVEQSS